MLPTKLFATALLLALSASSAALAQPADRAATVERTRSLITAPNTAPTGRVMPRPGRFDQTTTRDIEKRTKQQEEDSSITRGICVGCT
jgi:hypothetical protein